MKKWLWAVFALYAGLMLWLMLGRNSMDTGEDYWLQVSRNLNLQPLQTIRHQWRLLNMEKDWAVRSGVVNIYGNVLMFVPLGLLLPWINSRLRRLWRTLLASAAMITAVEIAQLLSLRGFGDVDDLLLNLIGCALGYFAWKVFVSKEKQNI